MEEMAFGLLYSRLIRDIAVDMLHTTYSLNIKWQKCAGMDLNGFIFKKK